MCVPPRPVAGPNTHTLFYTPNNKHTPKGFTVNNDDIRKAIDDAAQAMGATDTGKLARTARPTEGATQAHADGVAGRGIVGGSWAGPDEVAKAKARRSALQRRDANREAESATHPDHGYRSGCPECFAGRWGSAPMWAQR